MDESLPQYMGHYAGIWSSSPEVCKAVEPADLIVDIGGLLTHELNTGMWTSVPKAERIVSIQDNWVRVDDKVFLSVAIDDVLAALAKQVPTRKGATRCKPSSFDGRQGHYRQRLQAAYAASRLGWLAKIGTPFLDLAVEKWSDCTTLTGSVVSSSIEPDRAGSVIGCLLLPSCPWLPFARQWREVEEVNPLPVIGPFAHLTMGAAIFFSLMFC